MTTHIAACNRPEGHPDVRAGHCPTDHGGWVLAAPAEGVCLLCRGTGTYSAPMTYNGLDICPKCSGTGNSGPATVAGARTAGPLCQGRLGPCVDGTQAGKRCRLVAGHEGGHRG